MSELMRASRQWANRPSDERFWSVDELAAVAAQDRSHSQEKTCELKQLTARPDNGDIAIVGPSGVATKPTNWGFSQFCRLVGARADYMARLSAPLACECLNENLKDTENKPVTVLLRKNGDTHLRSITSDGYTRFWDSELCQMLKPAIDNGWMVPPARPSDPTDPRCRPATAADLIPGMQGGAQVRVGETIAPSGVYRGDRDSFVFLVNPNKPIDDGNGGGGLFKGLIASNSEVGKASIRFQSFCHEGVCGNHIIWGASQIVELKRKHYGDLSEFILKLRSWLTRWTATDNAATVAMIAAAKQHVLGATYDEVEEKVHKLGIAALTYKAIKASYEYAEKWEHTANASPRSAWGFVHGLTRYSQTLGFADQRFALDAAGGKVLDLAV